MKKKPKWYEPFSRYRKICWCWCLFVACFNMPGVFASQNGKNMHLIWVIFNLAACYLSFDQTWEKKPEDDI